MDKIITEERKQDMEELKKLNEIDMNAYIPQAREEVPEEEKN